MKDKLLTIGIPTYNRSSYLDKCLGSILNQIVGLEHLVDINVSDNSSSDSTIDIIEKYKNEGYHFKYSKNDTNIGLDNNFAALYEMANTKYIWMIGDDDFLFPNTLGKVLKVLQMKEFGVLFMNNYWYDKVIPVSLLSRDEQLKTVVYDNAIEFVERINIWLTFTSAMIINKSLIKDKINIYDFSNTRLIILSWIIPAIFQGKPSVVLEDFLVGCKNDNTGGYKVYEVFGKNFNAVLDKLIAIGIEKKIKPIINHHLLTTFFPTRINLRSDKFISENYVKVLLPTFWNYKLFWTKICFPYFKRNLKQKLKYFIGSRIR